MRTRMSCRNAHDGASVLFGLISSDPRTRRFHTVGRFLQIRAYVFDVVRATLPRMSLDQAFEGKVHGCIMGWVDG